MQKQKNPDFFWRLFCVIFCVAIFCGVFSYSDMAFAGGAPTTQPSEDTYYTGDLFCPYNYDALSGRIAHCIENIVILAAKSFLDTFLPFYEAIVISVLTLAVTIYGAMMLMGSIQRPTGQTFFLLFKIGAIAFLTLQFNGLIDLVFDVLRGMLGIVTNYVTNSTLSACSNTGYLSTFFEFGRNVNDLTAWDKIDCLFMTLLGIGVAQTTAFGLVAILVGVIFTGGVGVLIFILAIMFMITLLFAIIRALKIYLVSVIVIAFLVCVSPLALPAMLFQASRPMFDKWVKNLANFMLVPVFLFAYISMIVAAYDAILFKGPSSLYYAIASEASQEVGFNFRDWLAYGTDGEVRRDANGQAVMLSSGLPWLESGTFVGQDVPGLDAIALMNYRRSCATAADFEAALNSEICELPPGELDTMIDCAINPVVPFEGEELSVEPGESCDSLDGRPYYGFLRNEEVFHFGIAPGIETDLNRRKAARDEESCGMNILCGVKKVAGKMAGWAVNTVKNIIGAVVRVGGWLVQQIGSGIKAVGSFIKDYCNMGTSAPGAVCSATGGAFMVAGSVVHVAGTVGNFSGRVLMNGLAAELEKLLDGWFDVESLDLQKIASYHCKVAQGIADPQSEEYLDCPGPETIIMNMFYVLLTALVVAYLMSRWLNYIPQMGQTLVGGARIDASLPGEARISKAAKVTQTGMDKLLKKRGGGR